MRLDTDTTSARGATRCTFAAALALLAIAQPAWSKGVTVRIEVAGDALGETLAISEADVVSRFSVWSGPNSRWRGRDGVWRTDFSRIYIDFPAGAVASPRETVLRFSVEFFIASTPQDAPWEETFRVLYAFAPGESGGYMYLPTGNPLIRHGVEDNWFRSTDAWEAHVRPLIQRAIVDGK